MLHPVLWAAPASGKTVFCGSGAGPEAEKQSPHGVYLWWEVGGVLPSGTGGMGLSVCAPSA